MQVSLITQLITQHLSSAIGLKVFLKVISSTSKPLCLNSFSIEGIKCVLTNSWKGFFSIGIGFFWGNSFVSNEAISFLILFFESIFFSVDILFSSKTFLLESFLISFESDRSLASLIGVFFALSDFLLLTSSWESVFSYIKTKHCTKVIININ